MKPVSKVRFLKEGEWNILKDLFGKERLPRRQVILVTDGLGRNNAPFTVPTKLYQRLPGVAVLKPLLKDILDKPWSAASAAEHWLRWWMGSEAQEARRGTSAEKRRVAPQGTAYLLFVGRRGYSGMQSGTGYWGMPLLVHEMTHVWQGHNGAHPLQYVYQSFWCQVGSTIFRGTRDKAYQYRTRGGQLKDWKDCNPEEQAKLVEEWFTDAVTGTTKSAKRDPRWPYIRDYVRKGRVR